MVMFSSNARGDKAACFASTPINDQVPELTYAQLACPVFAVGTPATAEAVSCDGGAMTLTPARPVRLASDGRSAPSAVPGGTIFGRKCVGRPNFLSSGSDQLRRSGCTNCEVEAMVNSASFAPHRHQ